MKRLVGHDLLTVAAVMALLFCLGGMAGLIWLGWHVLLGIAL